MSTVEIKGFYEEGGDTQYKFKDEFAREALSSHVEDTDIHTTAAEKQAFQSLSSKVEGMYTNAQIDDMLAEYVTYVPLTIRCIASDDSVPSPVTISVKSRPSGDAYQTLTFTGTPVTCRVPEGMSYTVSGSDDLADYYNPVPVSGIAIGSTEIIIRYSKIGVIETFADIQTVTRIGKANQIFDLDDQIEVDTDGTFGKLQFDIVDFDNVHLEADSTERTLNLLLHDVLYGYQICAVQALIACPNGLPAGTYHFTLPTTYGSWVAGTYQFTTAVAVPEGGQLKLSSGSGNSTPLTDLALQMYASPYSTQIIESVAITSGEGGQNLGSWASPASVYNGVYINYWQRVAYGSNNYEQSALDQWLNAEGTNWWVAKCMFDRPPSYVAQEGFLSQLDAEFVAVLGEMTVKCHTNTVYEAPDAPHPVSTLYTLKRKIYLASRMEILGTAESVAMTDGSKQYASYVEKTENEDKIKYDHNNGTTSRVWWFRTPYVGIANNVRVVDTTGALGNHYAYYGYGAVPACTIC